MTHESACRLLEAIVSAWLADARRDQRELVLVARFLEVTPAEARRIAESRVRREATGTRRQKPKSAQQANQCLT